MKEKGKKLTKRDLAVKIVCGFLAFLMIAGVAYSTIYIFMNL